MAMENNPTFNTGETPTKGVYQCHKCGKFAIINKDGDELPNCRKCGPSTYFKKT